MLKKAGWLGAGLTLTALSTLASISLGAGSAEAAVVYCKTVGVPKGCVVRPTAPVVVAPVVAAPVAAAAVVTARRRRAGCGRPRRHADESWRSGRPRRPPLHETLRTLSAGSGVAVGKAAGQCQSDAGAAGAGA